MRLEGNIDACEAATIGGWARDADAPGQPLTLDVRIGATPIATIRADLPRADLAAKGLGDCRFHLPLLSPLAPADRDRLNLRPHTGTDLLVANLGGPQPDPWAIPMPPPGTRFRHAILHIGTEKTGTTTLQHFLAANRDRLADAGILVPASLAPTPDPLNHTHIVAHALADWRLNDELRTTSRITTPAALAQFRATLESTFAAEIAATPASVDILFLSSEHCHSRLLHLHEVAALRRVLAPWCASIEVWVYLRPQYALAASQHAMHLIAGITDAEMLPRLPYADDDRGPHLTDPTYFDYANLLARWSAIFGRDHLKPALFLPETLRDGDIVADILHRLGLPPAAFTPVPRAATNITPHAQTLLRDITAAIATHDPTATRWAAQRLGEKLRAVAPGPGPIPAPEAVARFMAQFTDGNETVRREWFPDRPTLFPPAPPAPDPAPFSRAALLDLFARVLLEERKVTGEG